MRYKGLIFWAHSFPVLEIKPRKYSARKNVWYQFWKDENMWCNSKQNECLCRSSRSKGFYKKFVLRNFPKSTRKHLCQSLFFEKVRRCRSATSWETRLQCECFLLSISKPVRTPFFAEYHRTATSDYRSINSSEGEIGKRNSNYDTEIKACQFEPDA